MTGASPSPETAPGPTDDAARASGSSPAAETVADVSWSRGLWVLVARREIRVKLTDRTFLYSTGFMVAFLVLCLGISAFLAERTQTFRLATTPSAQAMAQVVAEAAPSLDENVRVEVRAVPDEESARAAVSDGDVDAWLHLGTDGWVLTTKSRSQEPLEAVVAEVVRAQVLRSNLSEHGISAADLERGTGVQAEFLEGDSERATVVRFVGFAFAMMFYLATVVLGMSLAQSVLEEKQSRIVEIIVTAIPVRQLLAGKIVGNTVLALGQIVVYLVIGVIGLSLSSYRTVVPELSGPMAWFVVFFLAGFVALACLWAVAGALSARSEDLQFTAAPLTFATMGVFFGGIFLQGTWRVVGSFVPPLSAVLMPMHLLAKEATWWQALISLALLLAFSVVTLVVGERLYRRSLLQTGGKVGWRQAWRIEQ